MASVEAHVSLARSLPIRLQRFFALNPPAQVAARTPHSTATISAQEIDDGTSDSGHDRIQKLNPFTPHKHPKTGRWHPPIYSLRRQAELVKMARDHNVEDLLPFTVKKTAERQRRVEERGLRVKGTGEGQHVKGHVWERTLKGRLEKRRKAMLEMPRMIQEWRQVSSKFHASFPRACR